MSDFTNALYCGHCRGTISYKQNKAELCCLRCDNNAANTSKSLKMELPPYLEELKEIEKAVTPAPWRTTNLHCLDDVDPMSPEDDETDYCDLWNEPFKHTKRELRFISKMRNALPLILDDYKAMIESLRAERAWSRELEEALEKGIKIECDTLDESSQLLAEYWKDLLAKKGTILNGKT